LARVGRGAEEKKGQVSLVLLDDQIKALEAQLVDSEDSSSELSDM
jgi:hypothetical protein